MGTALRPRGGEGGVVEKKYDPAHFQTPSASDRQHLSYDACLEVRGEIIRTVLCCVVY